MATDLAAVAKRLPPELRVRASEDADIERVVEFQNRWATPSINRWLGYVPETPTRCTRRSSRDAQHTDADRRLADRGVTIMPDILANADGVVVSYSEWVQSRAQFYSELDEVEKRLEIYMRRASDLVLAKAKVYDCLPREAPFIVAVERVASAIEKRGIFP